MDKYLRWAGSALVAASLLAVAAVDFLTGVQVHGWPLYLLPLLIAAWALPKRSAASVALIATLVWAALYWIGGGYALAGWVFAVNVALQAVVFVVVTLLFARARQTVKADSELSRNDALTGLPNSRSFFERAGSVLAVCHRNNQPATLAYIDIAADERDDNASDHEEAAQHLRHIAELLNEQMRGSDIAARIADDEFVMLLPETGELAANIALEKLRARFNSEGLLNASIGAVTWTPAPPDINRMFKAADKVMHRVKAGPRNALIVQAAQAM